MLTPQERSIRARIGAHSLHSQHDTRVISAPGRKAAGDKLNARLLLEIDPEDLLSEDERALRLEHARRAHFSKLALKGSISRRQRQGAAS